MTLQTVRVCALRFLFRVAGTIAKIALISRLGIFEPENQKVLLPFLIMFKERFPNKTIWCYTGFTLEEIMGKRANSRAFTPISSEMLSLIDVLVDGPYIEDKKDISLVFRGSSNQRIIDVKKSFKNKQLDNCSCNREFSYSAFC